MAALSKLKRRGLRRAGLPPAGLVHLHYERKGAISDLRIASLEGTPPCSQNEVPLAIWAVGLNFRDVLNVLGEYPSSEQWLDGDCAGSVLAHEPHGLQLSEGDAVFGLAHAPLASRAAADARLITLKPPALSSETACTLPATWSTVHAALGRALLHQSQRILLHAAAGGVGLVAVDYSQCLGTAISVSVGNPLKHSHVPGVQARGSSRDGAALGFGGGGSCHPPGCDPTCVRGCWVPADVWGGCDGGGCW